MMKKFMSAVVLTVALSATIQANGQTASSTPTPDPALVALQAQQAIMDAKLKIQQDQQSLLTGALPASTTTPNTGAVTVTGNNPFESQKLAYAGLVKIAKTIACNVSGPNPVAVYDSTEINSLVNFKAIKKQLDLFQLQVGQLDSGAGKLDNQSKLLKILGPPPGEKDFAGALVPGLVEGSLKTAIDIVGLFRTNTNVAYSSFTADDAALAAAVVQALLEDKKDRPVYQSSVVAISAIDQSSAFMDELSAVQTTLASTQDKAVVTQSKIQQISDALGVYIQAYQAAQANLDLTAQAEAAKKAEQAAKQPALNQALITAHDYAFAFFPGAAAASLNPSTAIQKKAECDQFLKVMASFVSGVSTISTAFGALQTALMKVTDSGTAALTAVLRAEKLADLLKTQQGVILVVRTSVLGGSVVTRTNLWTGGHLYFTGGAIANFTLFKVDGSIAASGVVVGESGEVRKKF